MIEYRRSYRFEQNRAEALEAQKRVLEASVQAVEVCWNQVSLRPCAGYDCAAETHIFSLSMLCETSQAILDHRRQKL